MSRRLREVRAKRGLGLRAVARIAQISPSLLSQIENGLASPSLVSLVAIADALGVLPGDLLAQDANDFRTPVVRRGDRRVIDDGTTRREYMMHPDDPWLEVAELFLRPRASLRPNLAAHSGRDYAIVIEGTATVEFTSGHEELREGDYIAFDSGIRHRLVNNSDQNLRMIWVVALEAGPGRRERDAFRPSRRSNRSPDQSRRHDTRP